MLQLFSYENNNVRVLIVNEVAWFVLTDVLKAIKSTTTVTAAKTSIIEGLGEEFVCNQPLETEGGIQDVAVINESGITFIASRSKTELGKQLNRWIHSEVLPSVRKAGIYQTIPFKLSSDSSIVMFEGDDYWTTSLIIAELFGKEHYNVLRDLELAQEDILKFEAMSDSLPNFKIIETTYLDKYNRSTKSYKINRAVFNYVVLAYQGDKAKLYRMMFIKAFEELEKKVKIFLCQQMIYSNPKRQQVYVLRNTVSGLIKIGITNDIKRRLAELQNASGCEISVEFLAPKADNAKDVELTIHRLLDDKRGIGEWFNISSTEAVNILKQQDLIIESTYSIN